MGLKITRRAGDKILIGSDTIIEIVSVEGGQVRVKITAPRSVPISRGDPPRIIQAQPPAASDGQTTQ